MSATATAGPTAATTANNTADVIVATEQLPIQAPPRQQIASLYVGDLDPTVREEQLIELFRPIGALLGVRICRDIITQRSLGYAYVNFQSPADAEAAISTLNFVPVNGRPIRLMWQQRDPALRFSGVGNIFVKNLDPSTDNKGLYDLFKQYGTILSCKVVMDEAGKSRGYGFVHFKDEKSADAAIDQLNGKQLQVATTDQQQQREKEEKQKQEEDNLSFIESLFVARFIRRNARVAALLANFTNVYIKHVVPGVSKMTIETFFKKFGGITSTATKEDTRGRTFAFCNFASHDEAVKCIESMHDQDVDGLTPPGEKLFVQRAQARSERLMELRQKYMQRQALGNNLYIRNFGPDFSEEQLRDLFAEFGTITSCKVMFDVNGVGRGFGFVSFKNAEEASHAMVEMNGRMLNGKPLVVNIAQRRDHRYCMLQVQFQQRIQALLQRLPLLPFIAGAGLPSAAAAPRVKPKLPIAQQQQQQQQQQQERSPQHPAAASLIANPGLFPPLASLSVAKPAAPPPQRTAKVQQQQQQQQQQPDVPPAAAISPPGAPVAAAAPSPALAPITANELIALTPAEQKVALGERLFLRVSDLSEENAPKITGMLLEMEPLDLLNLLSNPPALHDKIEEALCVLRAHQIKKASAAPSA